MLGQRFFFDSSARLFGGDLCFHDILRSPRGTKEGKVPGILEYKALPKQWPFQVFGIASFFLPIQRYFRKNPSNHYEGVELIQQQLDAVIFSAIGLPSRERGNISHQTGKPENHRLKSAFERGYVSYQVGISKSGPFEKSKKNHPLKSIFFRFLRLNWPIFFQAIFGE